MYSKRETKEKRGWEEKWKQSRETEIYKSEVDFGSWVRRHADMGALLGEESKWDLCEQSECDVKSTLFRLMLHPCTPVNYYGRPRGVVDFQGK